MQRKFPTSLRIAKTFFRHQPVYFMKE